MEHFRSTIATASAAVLGLVAAAHILHPGNFEAQPRTARPALAAASAPAWVDPPRQITTEQPRDRIAQAPDVAAILAPRMMAAPPPDALMVAPLPQEMAAPASRSRKAERAQRRKLAQRAARIRQASLQSSPDRTGTAAATVTNSPAAAPAPAKSDPIGDLIRGLGFGRDS